MVVNTSPKRSKNEKNKKDSKEIEKIKIRNDVNFSANSSSIPKFFFPGGKVVKEDEIRSEMVGLMLLPDSLLPIFLVSFL